MDGWWVDVCSKQREGGDVYMDMLLEGTERMKMEKVGKQKFMFKL